MSKLPDDLPVPSDNPVMELDAHVQIISARHALEMAHRLETSARKAVFDIQNRCPGMPWEYALDYARIPMILPPRAKP